MSESTFPINATFQKQLKRRCALPLVSAATAMSLAGCGMLPLGPATSTQPQSPEQRVADQQVKAFTSDIEMALDKVDRERLRAAAEKKQVAPVSTTQPSVILASATTGQSTPAPSVAMATPTANIGPKPDSVTVSVTPSPLPTASPANPSPLPATLLATANSPSVFATMAAPITVSESRVASSAIMPSSPPAPAAAMGAMTAMLVPPAGSGDMISSTAALTPPVDERAADEALAVLRSKVAAHPTLGSALAIALLTANDTKADNSELVKSLSEPDQKVFTDLLTALESTKTTSPTATLTDRAAPLLDAAKKWQADADLTLPRLALATHIDSFGVYTPADTKFEQGKRHTVIIYCEVANFISEKGDDGWYDTKLAQQETLITDDGLLVWRPNIEEVEDRSMNQRHDFYLVKKLTIPETLAAGKYTLRMSVTDRSTNKISMVSLPVEIVMK